MSLTLLSPNLAVAEDSVKVKSAKGPGTCPATDFCLYEHANYNTTGGPARIWLFRTTDAYAEFSLKGRQAADKGRSAYNHTGKTAVIYDQWTSGESRDFVQMRPGAQLASLNNLGPDQGAGLYVTSQNSMVEHTYHDAKYAASLNLNDRVRSVKIGGQPPPGGDRPTQPDTSTMQPPETSPIDSITGPGGPVSEPSDTDAFSPTTSAFSPTPTTTRP